MEVYFEDGQIKYRGNGGSSTPLAPTSRHGEEDTRIRYHEKYRVGCLRMTKWQWTTIILLAASWMFVVGYMYIHYYHMGVSHADRMGQMMTAAEANDIPGVPGWFAAIWVQYMGRQAGMDGYRDNDSGSFSSWYNGHVDRTVQRYDALYTTYGVRHPYETMPHVGNKK
jgi:hypothetical protein